MENPKTFPKTTPYYMRHLEHGAQMMEKGGWIRPLVFTSVEDEVWTTRNAVGLIDAHSMGKVVVAGEDAYRFIQYSITNDLRRISAGKGIYTCLCNEEGGIIDDIVVYYVNEHYLYLITNTLSRDRVVAWLQKIGEAFRVNIFDATNATAYLAIQGPASIKLLLDVFKTGLPQKYFEFTNCSLGNVPVLLARTGYTGETGFELNFPSEYGIAVWDYLLSVGKTYGIKPIGGLAAQVLRTEKAYLSYGTDMTEANNPYEVGLGWVVRMEKEDFLGKNTLQRIKSQGVSQKLRGFEVTADVELEKGTPLYADEEKVGFITTSCYSPTLGKRLAMGYVSTHASHLQNFAPGPQRDAIVHLVPTPFFDAQGKHLRIEVQ